MLRHVIVNIRKQSLEAVVQDRLGKFRKIRLSWKTPDAVTVPPVSWSKMVYAECEFQMAHSGEARVDLWPR